MLTPNGFIKQDDFEKILKEAECVEIKCPRCKEMTRVEPIGSLWECLECGEIWYAS